MHAFAWVLRELSSHLSPLETYARRFPCMDADLIDILVGLRMGSIWLTLRDDDLLRRLFSDGRFSMAFTALLARTYALLDLVYLPSQHLPPGAKGYGVRAIQRIREVLQEHAWSV